MDTIKASNVWDEDYIPPAETDKKRGECAKIYMELRDLDVRLDDIEYRQISYRRVYSVCIVVAAVFIVLALIIGADQLFIARMPISGIKAYIVNGGILIGTLLAGIPSLVFFSAMSVHPFWAGCANIIHIGKLEMQRLALVREKSALKARLEELEKTI